MYSSPRITAAVTGLLASTCVLATVALAPSATAQHAQSAVAQSSGSDLTLTPIGSSATGAFNEGGSEIVAHDPVRQRLFSINAKAGTVDVLSIADPTRPVRITQLRTPGANSPSGRCPTWSR